MKNKLKGLNIQLFADPGVPMPGEMTTDEIKAALKEALKEGDTEKFGQHFTSFMSAIENKVMAQSQGLIVIDDSNVLQSRGVRQLTSKENEFYQKTIEAMQATTPKDSISALDVVMPETVIDSVFEDLRGNHELLSIIDFKNVTGLTKILLNTNARQLAQWGPSTEEIKKELESGFKSISIEQNKLSAFLFVSQDMLDLGPVWLDRYAREVMYEALALGLEYGIIAGTGKDMPIGMMKDISEGVSVTGGVYPDKTVLKITSFEPVEYGKVLAKLTKNEKGFSRKIEGVILVVNPTDYFLKVMPATTAKATDMRYVNDILPFPTRIVQSTEVPEGKAVIGMADKYFMGMGLVKDGKIEYSDEYKFLEDLRTYKIRFLGHGQAKDNNDFLLLDISELQPAILKVENIAGKTGE